MRRRTGLTALFWRYLLVTGGAGLLPGRLRWGGPFPPPPRRFFLPAGPPPRGGGGGGRPPSLFHNLPAPRTDQKSSARFFL